LWFLEHIFESVKGNIEELRGILLHSYIDWLASILVGKAEVTGVVVLPIGELQTREEALPLMEPIVVNLTTLELFWLWIFTIVCCKKWIAEDGNVEELLEHWVHVAGTTEILQTCKPIGCSVALTWVVVALGRLLHSHD
jgi:hypothetical protein